jgi:hypothetical protein
MKSCFLRLKFAIFHKGKKTQGKGTGGEAARERRQGGDGGELAPKHKSPTAPMPIRTSAISKSYPGVIPSIR